MLVYCMTGKTEAYGAELLNKKKSRLKKKKKNRRWQEEGEEGRKGLSQGVAQKGADT